MVSAVLAHPELGEGPAGLEVRDKTGVIIWSCLYLTDWLTG